MTTCPEGHKNPEGQRFCGECGVRIQTESEPSARLEAFKLVTIDIELPGKGGVLRKTEMVPVDDEAPVPGWYPQPDGAQGQRYWDGTSWTQHRVSPTGPPRATPTPSTSAQRSRSKTSHSSGSRFKALAIGGAALLVLLVCAIAVIVRDGSGGQNKSSTSTSATGIAPPTYATTSQSTLESTATVSQPLTSTLLGLVMPPGSRLTQGVTSRGNDQDENWESGADFDETVSMLRPQLPIGKPLQGVPWCKEDFYQPTRMLSWVWGAAPGTPWIDVEIDPEIGKPAYAVVFMTVKSDSAGGCGP